MSATVRGGAARSAVRELASDGRFDEAWAQLRPLLLTADESGWSTARNLLRSGAAAGWAPPAAREIRLAVLCTYEAGELREQLRIACAAMRIAAELYEAPYGQLEQELLGAASGLAAFAPTHVLIAPTTSDLGLPELSDDPDAVLDAAESRWRTLWQRARELGARVVQHAFVVPDQSALGHLAMRVAGSRLSLVRELNARLARAAGDDVLLVDVERVAARFGKQRWSDARLWHAARQPIAPHALSRLALETMAVCAGDVGLSARCLVLDLDGTLWGGIVGEDGSAGIVVGDGPDGEAYAAFQDYVSALGRRGVILAIASKNDPATAREPFRTHTGMRLSTEEFAVFVADWRPKSQQLAEIAATLGIGLDAIVFADDNPAECAEVAAALPDVTTICLDVPPSERVALLDGCVRFELPSLSVEDRERQRSYAARAAAVALAEDAASIEDFWRSLDMRARVEPVGERSLDRAVALSQKTNQFNLTLRRYGRAEIERLAHDPAAVCVTLELEDRFARHGLVGLGIVVASDEEPDVAVIDTLLLSCRVIGRTAENHLLSHVARAAAELGYTRLRGTYVPGPRNGLVADLYPRLGFAAAGHHRWERELGRDDQIASPYIAEAP